MPYFTRSVPGLILLALGVGFLLDSLGLIHFSELLSVWWPVAIILVGLAGFSNGSASKVGPTIITLVGVVFLLNRLEVLNVNVWATLWPFILILVGGSMLLSGGRPSSKLSSNEKSVDLLAVFGGSEKQIGASDFKGGSVAAIFGGSKLDLRKATMNEGASVSASVAFGGVEILVPESCEVDIRGLPLFGGFADKTIHPTEPKSRLIIHGTAIFGAVEVKN